MAKPRIFIAIHYLELGGAEMSLIGLLQSLDYSRHDVDLFVYSHRGELIEFIPKEVTLLPEIPEYAQIERPMKEVLKGGYWRILAARLKARWKTKRYIKAHPSLDSAVGVQYVADYLTPHLPAINPDTTYDLAISFLTPHNIVRDKVRAKRKAAWIHTDYSTLHINPDQELPVWSSFDTIVSISDDVTKAFLRIFPSLKDKIVLIGNILSPLFVRERAESLSQDIIEKEMPSVEGRINLLSVGRFCTAKNYDNVPEICRSILESGLDVRWYLIGYGGDEKLIRDKIAVSKMEEYVIILGKKPNPYPYIKACDYYVQPSRYEGNSVTVREAQMLCKPVIVTDYPTAGSQIQDGVDGVIVPMDNSRCAAGIADFVLDGEKRRRIVNYLKSHDYGNISEAKKVDVLLK